MTHELLNLQYQSHGTLSIILMGIGVSAVAVIGLRTYVHWRDRHRRRAEAVALSARKAVRKPARKRRRH